jgi:hypothetical protein
MQRIFPSPRASACKSAHPIPSSCEDSNYRLARTFPLDMYAFGARLAAGDEQARQAFALGIGRLQEAKSGLFRSWDDLTFLRANRDGPIVLKGIQIIDDAHAAMDAHVASSSLTTVRTRGPERARGCPTVHNQALLYG